MLYVDQAKHPLPAGGRLPEAKGPESEGRAGEVADAGEEVEAGGDVLDDIRHPQRQRPCFPSTHLPLPAVRAPGVFCANQGASGEVE